MKTLWLFLWLLTSCLALADEPKIRVSFPAKAAPWVGQRTTFAVDLLAPGYFASAPSFDLPKTPGLLLTPPTDRPTLSSETIDGTTYTVQRHELSVFARHGGDQTIPPFTIRFRYKRQPLDKETVPAAVQTDPIAFTAKVPPGAEGMGNLISARNLEVKETWKPEAKSAKAGDAFSRTIIYTAPEVPAMAFPPFPQGQIDGVAIYPKPSSVLDRSDRGSLTGERHDELVYVFQRPGRFVIPAVRLTWFDLETQALRTSDLPARAVEVAANPALAGAVPATAAAYDPRLLAKILAALATVVATAWVFRRYGYVAPFRPVHLVPLNPGNGGRPADDIKPSPRMR